jgi:hypothetical protein
MGKIKSEGKGEVQEVSPLCMGMADDSLLIL